jgi:hypothetical protein
MKIVCIVLSALCVLYVVYDLWRCNKKGEIKEIKNVYKWRDK